MTAPCLCCSCLLHIYMTFDMSEWSPSNAYIYQVSLYEGRWEDLPDRCAMSHHSVYIASCELFYLGMTCWVTTELTRWHSMLYKLGFVYYNSGIPYFCNLLPRIAPRIPEWHAKLCMPFCCMYSGSVSF